jgi:hypothetical protein
VVVHGTPADQTGEPRPTIMEIIMVHPIPPELVTWLRGWICPT